MASIIKLPHDLSKGILVFTTSERDLFIRKSSTLGNLILSLKKKWVIGLHHNSAHKDHDFVSDNVFDFHIAGHGDLAARDGKKFLQIEMDCSNFCPDFFEDTRREKQKFWDVLAIGRNAAFKNLDELLTIVREIFDTRRVRVLAIIAHKDLHAGGQTSDIIKKYLEMFSDDERKYFTMMTPSIDYPFCYDLETLAHFYKHSKVFLHVAREERHPRVVAYAWAAGIPVVARENAASLLPGSIKMLPGFYGYETPQEASRCILDLTDLRNNEVAREYSEFHLIGYNVEKFKRELGRVFAALDVEFSDERWLLNNLDIRLARHHVKPKDRNSVGESVSELIFKLKGMSDSRLRELNTDDFERSLQEAKFDIDSKSGRQIENEISQSGKQSWRKAFKSRFLHFRRVST